LKGAHKEQLKARAQEILTTSLEQLSKGQELLYADDRFAVLIVLQALDAAVESVQGYTRYAIDGATNGARIRVVAQGGSSKGIASRTFESPVTYATVRSKPRPKPACGTVP